MFEMFFNPKSVALIGATDRKDSVGAGICRNLLEGKEKREIYFINPYRKKVFGIKTFKNIQDIQKPIDLAIIAVPAKIVPQVAKDCAQKKVKGVIIISAGFAEIGEKGKKLQDEVLAILKKGGVRLIGPNCLGIIRPSQKLNASFAPLTPQKGEIALISQSGAIIDSLVDKSLTENFGFSLVISYGNEADLKLIDFLEYAKEDSETKVITIYLESLKEGSEFIKVAKEISKRKPIIILKGGRGKITQKAVQSHTGSLTTDSILYSIAFKKAGIFEVNNLTELMNVSKALTLEPKIKNEIAILTNGGGLGILLTDSCEKYGLNLAKISKETISKIDKSLLVNKNWSKKNPVDIVGDATEKSYYIALKSLLEQKNISGVIVAQSVQVMTKPDKNAKIVLELKKEYPEKAIVCCFVGGKINKGAEKIFERNKILNFQEPEIAALVMKSLTYFKK
jgi:acetyltransferase